MKLNLHRINGPTHIVVLIVDERALELDRHECVTVFTGQWEEGKVDREPKGVHGQDDDQDAEEEAEVHCRRACGSGVREREVVCPSKASFDSNENQKHLDVARNKNPTGTLKEDSRGLRENSETL